MEYEFNDIPIEIDGKVHAVTYRYTETDKYGQAYHIISEGKELYAVRSASNTSLRPPLAISNARIFSRKEFQVFRDFFDIPIPPFHG